MPEIGFLVKQWLSGGGEGRLERRVVTLRPVAIEWKRDTGWKLCSQNRKGLSLTLRRGANREIWNGGRWYV